MKLNLACGTDIKDGWLNLDIVHKWPSAIRPCDQIWDARKDKIPCPDGEATDIYAGYLLLHLAPMYHGPVLSEIRRVSNPETRVVFGEVDMEIAFRRFLTDPLDRVPREIIWGEQGSYHGAEFNDFDKHCCGFTEQSLRTTLLDAGFHDIKRISIHHADVWWELTLECRKSR